MWPTFVGDGFDDSNVADFTVTSMLVTDVGDQMCW